MLSASMGAVLLLLFLSALLTAAHAAALQIGPSRLRTLRDEGFQGAEALAKVREQAALVRWSVRIVTGALNLGAMGIGIATGAFTFGRGGGALDVGIGVAIVIFLAEILPHALAGRAPVRLSLSAAPALLGLRRWTHFLSGPASRFEDVMGGDSDQETPEERELREIQEIGQESGLLEDSENLLVERAFRLDDLTAWDVMVPRVDIFAWKQDLTLAEIVESLSDVPYSRVPVYDDSVDDVTGIVFVREVYERIAQGKLHTRLAELSRDPFFVPGSLSCTQLLHDFQSRRIHMGIVSDEFGGTDGLVTLEDVLEELVGEIHDETDVAEQEIVRESESQLLCDAGVDLRDINEALGVSLPKVEHRSLNGLILEELGHVPPEGESLETAGVRIDILEASETQVLRARVTRLVEAPKEL